jgi:hypothetical protein
VTSALLASRSSMPAIDRVLKPACEKYGVTPHPSAILFLRNVAESHELAPRAGSRGSSLLLPIGLSVLAARPPLLSNP